LIYAPLGICENLEGGINFSMKNQPKIVILNRMERARRIVKTDTQKIRLKILKTLEGIYNKPGYHTPKIQKHRTRRKTRAWNSSASWSAICWSRSRYGALQPILWVGL